ncbi:MAG: hypothetical protein ACXW5J_26735 [Thermoanaerobaculia bacterium]
MALDINRAMDAFHRGAGESKAARQYIDRAILELPFSARDVWHRVERLMLLIGPRRSWPLRYLAEWAIDELTAEWAGTAISVDRRPGYGVIHVTYRDIFDAGVWDAYCLAHGTNPSLLREHPDAANDMVALNVEEARELGLYDHNHTRCECDMHGGGDEDA